jgi:hypothetical protein
VGVWEFETVFYPHRLLVCWSVSWWFTAIFKPLVSDKNKMFCLDDLTNDVSSV